MDEIGNTTARIDIVYRARIKINQDYKQVE